MAYAAYHESFGINSSSAPPARRPGPCALTVLELKVASCDAFQVRRVLADCPDTAVLRCVPKLHDNAVLLEVQLPSHKVQEVLHLLMDHVPRGELGTLTSWRSYLTSHGMTHGF